MAKMRLADVKENMMKWYPFRAEGNCLILGNMDFYMVEGIRQCVAKVTESKLPDELLSGEKFDYILIYECLSPELLHEVKKRLLPGGKILVFSDNRIGLRYFSGSRNLYTDRYFSGLNGGDSARKIKSYTRKEICAMLDSEGDWNYKFYYLYPDQTILKEVFTDESLEEFEYGKDYYNYTPGTFELFSECRASKIFLDEGVIGEFANYFLVEVSSEKEETSVIYAKINSFRKREFQIVTVIKQTGDKRVVEKYGTNPEAVCHVKKMLRFADPKEMDEIDRGITCKYFTSKNLDHVISEYIEQKKVESIYQSVSDAYAPYLKMAGQKEYRTEEFVRVFGEENVPMEFGKDLKSICPANVDMICDNIILEQDGNRFIDQEWVFDFDIPVLFILWRCIRELYAKHVTLPDLIPYGEFLKHFDICPEMDEVFLCWTKHFVEEYVGVSAAEKNAIARIPIELKNIYLNNCNASEAKLYYDLGDGFSEEHVCKEILQTDRNGNFTLKYVIPSGAMRLRWKPVEVRSCCCRIFETNGRIVSHNGKETPDGQMFDQGDPLYVMDLQGLGQGKTDLILKGRIKIWDLLTTAKNNVTKNTQLQKQIYNILLKEEEQKTRYKKLEEDNHNLHEINSRLQEENNVLAAEYDAIINSRSWKLILVIKKLLKRV